MAPDDLVRWMRPGAGPGSGYIVVNGGVHLPRADRRRFRAILHNCRASGLASQAHGHADVAAYLAGYAAYARMVEPALGRRWIAEVDALLGAGGG
ncbi:MAG TPA: hypothetical protein VH165_09415 [Kofleriaceae bacterium]|nr:hypothetical protein [Kofleriaceae bacterium]